MVLKHKLYIVNLLFMCYLSRNLTFLIINVYYTLILTLDYVEQWFSSTSVIGIKQNFALTLDINTYCWKIPSVFKDTITFILRYTNHLKFPDFFEVEFGHITGF